MFKKRSQEGFIVIKFASTLTHVQVLSIRLEAKVFARARVCVPEEAVFEKRLAG